MSPEATAAATAAAMWAEDRAAQGLGMRLERVAPGVAVLSMPVVERMVNGHGLCHGGYIFTLADTALAYAANSRGQSSLTQSAQIAFIAPGRLGERLYAEAGERHRAERSAILDVTVTDGAGTVVAELRGHTRAAPGLTPRPSASG